MKIQDNTSNPDYDSYVVSFWAMISSGFTIIIGFGISLYLFILTLQSSFGDKIFAFLFVVVFSGLLIYVFNRYHSCSNQQLQISNEIFFFGNKDDLQKCNKNNITQIKIYQPGGGGAGNKRLHYFYVYEIIFKDGSLLKFSNMLISEQDVLDNFPKELVRYEPQSPFWRL